MTITAFVIIACVALLASLLTFFSGFGLGTILMPCIALFLPLELAIGVTAVVHLLTNIFKFGLTFRNIDKSLYIRFGIASILGALLGALLLTFLEKQSIDLYSYMLGARACHITIPKLVIGMVILFFVIYESRKNIRVSQAKLSTLVTGGLLSGFFGGLSGNQGALRTTFLSALKLEKEKFIATGIAIALGVDVMRLSIYGFRIDSGTIQEQLPLICTATLAAFAGAFFGSKLLNKITVSSVQKIVAIALVVISLAMIAGIV
ncbi:MAG: TSUP family transporter [Bacteroidia bacterium]